MRKNSSNCIQYESPVTGKLTKTCATPNSCSCVCAGGWQWPKNSAAGIAKERRGFKRRRSQGSAMEGAGIGMRHMGRVAHAWGGFLGACHGHQAGHSPAVWEQNDAVTNELRRKQRSIHPRAKYVPPAARGFGRAAPLPPLAPPGRTNEPNKANAGEISETPNCPCAVHSLRSSAREKKRCPPETHALQQQCDPRPTVVSLFGRAPE